MLVKRDVQELQAILERVHGKKLDLDEVRTLGNQLVNLYSIVLTPDEDVHKDGNVGKTKGKMPE